VAKTVKQTITQNVQGWKPELANAPAQASTQLDAWRSLLGEQIEAWRETTETTGEQAVSNLKQFQKTVSKNASKGLEGWITTLGALGVLAGDQLQELGYTLGNQVEDWRDVLGGALASTSPSFPQSLGNSAKAVTNAPRRAVRRGMVGMRWFRRGIFFGALVGAIGGLFFAPVPGSQLRTTIATWFQQLGGQAQTVATSALNTAQRATGTAPGATTGTTTGTAGGTLSGTRPTR
jgi:gas vesicle protein